MILNVVSHTDFYHGLPIRSVEQSSKQRKTTLKTKQDFWPMNSCRVFQRGLPKTNSQILMVYLMIRFP